MKKLVLGLMAVFILGTVAPAAAAPIVGKLSIEGAVIVDEDTIDWYFPVGPPDGDFETKNPSTGYFANIVDIDAQGDILDLDAVLGPPLPVAGFLNDFQDTPDDAKYGDLTFTLNSVIEPAVEECEDGVEYAEGETCRIGLFLLTEGAGAVTIKLQVTGEFVHPVDDPDGAPATGTFTTVIDAGFDSIKKVNDQITAGGSINTGFTAEFNVVPEPATLLTFGVGTAMLAAHRKRRAKKSGQA